MNNKILLNKIIYKVLNEQTNLKTLIRQIQNEQTEPTGSDDDDWETESGNKISIDMTQEDIDIGDFMDGLGITHMNIDSAQVNNITSQDTIATNFADAILVDLDALEDEKSGWEWINDNIIDIGTLALGVALYLLATGRILGARTGAAKMLLGRTLLGIEGKIVQILLPPAESKPTLWSEYVSNNLRKVLGKNWFTGKWADVKTQLETQLDDLFESKAISSTTRNDMKTAIRNYDGGIIEARIRAKYVRQFIKQYRTGKVSASQAMEVYKNAEKEIQASDKEIKDAFQNMKNEIEAHAEARVQAAMSDIEVNVGYKTNTETQAEIQTQIDNLRRKKERINKDPASINAYTEDLQEKIDDLQGDVNFALYGDRQGAPRNNVQPRTQSKKKWGILKGKQRQIAEMKKELKNIKIKIDKKIDKMIKDERTKLASSKPATELKGIQRAKPSTTDITWLDVKNYTEKYNRDYWNRQANLWSKETWEQFAIDLNTLKNDSRLQYLSKYENWSDFPSFEIWIKDIRDLRSKGVPKESLLRVNMNGNPVPDIKTQYRCQRYFWETKRQ